MPKGGANKGSLLPKTTETRIDLIIDTLRTIHISPEQACRLFMAVSNRVVTNTFLLKSNPEYIKRLEKLTNEPQESNRQVREAAGDKVG